MKRQMLFPLLFVSTAFTGPPAYAADVGTAFTYQGELLDAGGPVSGDCDFEFTLWDDEVAGSAVGPVLTDTIELAEGKFTTVLDFGAGAMNGDARWLEIDVCCLSPCSPAFTTLSPRQELTPSPHAVRAMDGVGPPNALEVDAVTGRIGIGTAAPTDPLTVAGFIRSTTGGFKLPDGTIIDAASDLGTGDITAVTAGTGLTGGGTSGSVTLNVAYSGTGAANNSARGDHYHSSLAASDGTPANAVTVDTAGSLQVDGTTFNVKSDTNRVGIGTDTPTQPLDVNGSIRTYGAGGALTIDGSARQITVGSDETLRIYSNTTATNSRAWIELWGDDVSRAGELALSGTYLSLRSGSTTSSSGTERARLDASGNLGIGTTAPEVKLHIAGGSDASPGGGGYLTLGSTTSTNLAMDNNEILARNNGAVATLTLNTEGGDVHLIPTGTGDVGIGTNSPTEKLHVNGNLRVNGTVSIPTTTGYASFAHSIWTPSHDGLDFDRVIGDFTHIWGPDGNTVEFYAALQLPHGSTITEAQVTVYDVMAPDPVVYLYRERLTNNSVTYLASENSVGSPGTTVLTMASINSVVDNSLYAYYMVVQFTDPPSGVYGVGNIRITYTMNALRP